MGLDTRTASWSAGRKYGSEVEHGLAILNQCEPGQVAYLRSCGTQLSLFRVVRDAENTPRILRVSSTSANSIATIQLKGPSCSRMKSAHWSGTIPIPVLENIPSRTASSAIPRTRKRIGRASRPLGDFGPSNIPCGTHWLGMDSGCIMRDLANAGRPPAADQPKKGNLEDTRDYVFLAPVGRRHSSAPPA